MTASVAVGLALAIPLSGSAALAQASPGTAVGRQDPPPGPPLASSPSLVTDPDQRRAIRGCPVDQDCRGPALDGLREFEIEAFGSPPGQAPVDPWVDTDDPFGLASMRRSGRATPGHGARAPASPTELRPDLPWLAELELPDIPVRWHERIIRYLEFYKDDPRGRNIMRGWLRRQGRFRDLIRARLRDAGLPEDLLYVAMIESSYVPDTTSRVGAGGLWQFMPAGARIYGLWRDRWIDERHDPVRSTDAVVMYWADLYQRFGDWHLAMAAYNAGYGAVLRSIARYNTNDYWELIEYENGLPWGTSLYVSKAVAAAIVGRNRALFGFDDIDEDAPMRWDQVTVPKSVSLSTLARAAGTTVDTLRALNPQLRRNRTPPTINGYVLRIPAGSRDLFATRFAQLRGDWDRYDAYVMSHGERLEDVATVHGISRRKLARLNGIEHESEVGGGTVLVVPQVSDEDKHKNRAEAEADLYSSGAPESEEDERLLVAVPDHELSIPGHERLFYRVVTGDDLGTVAAAFQVRREALAGWNDLAPEARLHPRMVLQVFVPDGFRPVTADGDPIALLDDDLLHVVTRGSDEHLAAMEKRVGRERVVYSPEQPESFETIGKKFGLGARDLARINRRPHDTVVEPGEEVIVYKVVDRSRSDRADQQARTKARHERKSKPRRRTEK
ncbi:transglycosylase SLT domain-containing protein [Haliangium sp.]|uniref:transglycosylase SLT domain-containing protein n=1 Tax=Haliangium sp. TaxID=2663208 RepID=UPI003D0A7200